jgi:hypothetical protein
MRQAVVFVVVLAAVTLAVGGMTRAQEEPGTPDLETILCASPEASPEASPAVSPDVATDASPDVAAEEVEGGLEEVEEDLEEGICGTPDASESP